MAIQFTLHETDGKARLGRLETPHGGFDTPIFMPVGTQGTVKGLTPDQIHATGAKIILGNTYHLTLRPGDEVVRDLGGLHPFMGWQKPILTDSGGFQVFSLGHIRELSDHGASFRSHLDGSLLELTPERAVQIQENLGSDIAMVLDECPPGSASKEDIQNAVRRTILWAERSRKVHKRSDQALFAIVQGGTDLRLREECAKELIKMEFPGYALGGFSVGESAQSMHIALEPCADFLPTDKPRYLMGVGRPEDLLAGVAAGIDMFDCVMPTRNGRNATGFVMDGNIRMRNSCHKRDSQPIESGCICYTCKNFSRAYVHHLFNAEEMLGPILLSIHNIAFYLRLMDFARQAIVEKRFHAFRLECLARWAKTN